VHAPRIERKTLREVVLSITNKRIERMLAKRIEDGDTMLHNGYTNRSKSSVKSHQNGYTKVTQAAVEAERCSGYTVPKEGYTSRRS